MTELYLNDAKGVHPVTDGCNCTTDGITCFGDVVIKPPRAKSANLPRSPLSAAQRQHNLLKPRPLSAFNTPLNTGPLNVRRATGINASH